MAAILPPENYPAEAGCCSAVAAGTTLTRYCSVVYHGCSAAHQESCLAELDWMPRTGMASASNRCCLARGHRVHRTVVTFATSLGCGKKPRWLFQIEPKIHHILFPLQRGCHCGFSFVAIYRSPTLRQLVLQQKCFQAVRLMILASATHTHTHSV